MNFYETLTAAVADITEHGFDTTERIDFWLREIGRAAAESLISATTLEQTLNDMMRGIYRRLVERGEIAKLHPGIGRFTLRQVAPKLRAELDRRIMASADLIRLNREQAIAKTLQRFQGWSTSIPAGGSKTVDRVPVKTEIRKALASLPWRERVVLVDQGHKFRAALSDILAHEGGAIAGIWRHHYVQYPREDHVDRAGQVFLVRGSWAHAAGLVKPGQPGYVDEIERPAELVYCRCTYQWLHALRDLPADMLTAKGRDELARARVAAA